MSVYNKILQSHRINTRFFIYFVENIFSLPYQSFMHYYLIITGWNLNHFLKHNQIPNEISHLKSNK